MSTRTIRVAWAPEAIERAIAELIAWRDADWAPHLRPSELSLMAAIDTMRHHVAEAREAGDDVHALAEVVDDA